MNELIITKPDELAELVNEAVTEALTDHKASNNSNQDEVLTNRQAMEYLHVSRSTLQRWRNDGKLPFRKVQGKILYTKEDILKLLEEARK